MAFPTDVDRADRSCGLTPPCPLPCQGWHDNRVTRAHHEEVGLIVDGPTGAPPSGAAAVAPPPGARYLQSHRHMLNARESIQHARDHVL
jgi:hypothetical protein